MTSAKYIGMDVHKESISIAVRLHVRALARSDQRDLQFEEEPAPAVLELGLFRDGAVIGSRSSDPPST